MTVMFIVASDSSFVFEPRCLKSLKNLDIMESILSRLCSNNTQVYNLISVLQVTRLLLGDAIILSKTDPRNGSKKENRRMVRLEIIKH